MNLTAPNNKNFVGGNQSLSIFGAESEKPKLNELFQKVCAVAPYNHKPGS